MRDETAINRDIGKLALADYKPVARASKRLAGRGPQVIPHLIGALKTSPMLGKCRIAMYLGKSGGEGVFEALVDLMDDPAHEVRYDAMISLGYLRDDRAVPILLSIMILDDDEFGLSCAAGMALAKLGSLAAPAMIDLASHTDSPDIRCRAIRTLRQAGVPNASEIIARYLSDPDVDVRTEATEQIAMFNSDGACDLLIGMLDDSEEKVRQVATYWIDEIGCVKK